MGRYTVSSVLRACYPDPNTIVTGEVLQLSADDGWGVYDLTVTGIGGHMFGRNVVTISGTIPFVGFPVVQAKLWKRDDDRWFIGVDQVHLAELEAAE